MIRHIMPWKADGPGDLTILCARGRRLTKLITPAGHHRIRRGDVVRGRRGPARRRRGRRGAAAAELVGTPAPASSAPRSAPLARWGEIRRRVRDRDGIAARFAEVPRSWVMIDLEPASAPAWVDPVDPVLIGGWLRRQLPAPFRSARCVVQLSSGAGVKPGLRAHLWFLARPADARGRADALAGAVPGSTRVTFRTVQIHYTASPIFDGVDDPCIGGRIAVLPGYAEVAVPELAPERPRPAFVPVGGASVSSASDYAEAVLRRLAVAPPGKRHRAILAAGCRLFEVARAGQLDPVRVVSQIKGVARPWGDLAEVDRLLEWCWATVQPKGLSR